MSKDFSNKILKEVNTKTLLSKTKLDRSIFVIILSLAQIATKTKTRERIKEMINW